MSVALVLQPFDTIDPDRMSSLALTAFAIGNHLKSQYKVLVYAPWNLDSLIRRKADRDIEVVLFARLPESLSRTMAKLFPRDEGDPFFSCLFYHPEYFSAVARNIAKRRCRIAHVFNFPQAAWLIKRYCPEITTVLHMQCEWLSQLNRKRIARYLEASDSIIGCSNHVVEGIVREQPASRSKCKLIYNGVEEKIGCFRETIGQSDDPVVLYTGRLSPEKGVHLLIEAMMKDRCRNSRAKLVLVGGAGSAPKEFLLERSTDPHVADLKRFYRIDYRRYLDDLAERCGKDRVVFTGHLNRERVDEWYRKASLVVVPSLSEALGYAALEAMSWQLPVVASRVGGLMEVVIDGKTGILVEPGNSDRLGEAISSLLVDQSRRDELGRAGRLRIEENFTLKRSVEQMVQIYESVHLRQRNKFRENDSGSDKGIV